MESSTRQRAHFQIQTLDMDLAANEYVVRSIGHMLSVMLVFRNAPRIEFKSSRARAVRVRANLRTCLFVWWVFSAKLSARIASGRVIFDVLLGHDMMFAVQLFKLMTQ